MRNRNGTASEEELKITNYELRIRNISMKENVVLEKSYKFAIRIAKLYLYLRNEKGEFELSKQILRRVPQLALTSRKLSELIHGKTSPQNWEWLTEKQEKQNFG